MSHRNTKTIVVGIVTACVVVVGAYPAMAQQKINIPPAIGKSTALTPATTQNPARLRNLLQAIHGFSKASLEAASTDVPVLLRGFISDPAETVTVKRQAIKALRFYSDEENLVFIKSRVNQAPAGLKRLYTTSLGRFSGTLQTPAASVLAALVEDSDAGVRHAAIGAAQTLGLTAELRTSLVNRLAKEKDGPVRRALSKALGN